MRSEAMQRPIADDRLMLAFRRGDVAAAEELFVRFAPIVLRIGLHTLHDADLASAFVEQTFIRMWQLASRFSPSSLSLDAWVVRQMLAVGFGRTPTADRARWIGAFHRPPRATEPAEHSPFGTSHGSRQVIEEVGST